MSELSNKVVYEKIGRVITFEKLRSFFQDSKNTTIINYEIHNGCEFVESELNCEEHLRCCDICGVNLYKTEADIVMDNPVYRTKILKHYRIRDNAGRNFYTCFKTNSCYNKIGWEYKDEMSEEIFYSVPDANSFSNFYHLENEDFDETKVNLLYQKNVLPFLTKWKYIDISKQNLNIFLQDLKLNIYPYLESSFYEKDKELYLYKIMKIIGAR